MQLILSIRAVALNKDSLHLRIWIFYIWIGILLPQWLIQGRNARCPVNILENLSQNGITFLLIKFLSDPLDLHVSEQPVHNCLSRDLISSYLKTQSAVSTSWACSELSWKILIRVDYTSLQCVAKFSEMPSFSEEGIPKCTPAWSTYVANAKEFISYTQAEFLCYWQ